MLLFTSSEAHKMSPSLGRRSLASSAVWEPIYPGLAPIIITQCLLQGQRATSAMQKMLSGQTAAMVRWVPDWYLHLICQQSTGLKPCSRHTGDPASSLLPSTVSPVTFKTKRLWGEQGRNTEHIHTRESSQFAATVLRCCEPFSEGLRHKCLTRLASSVTPLTAL